VNETVPIINHYGRIGKLHKIDSTKSPDAVYAEVAKLFKPWLQTTLAFLKPDTVKSGKKDEVLAKIKAQKYGLRHTLMYSARKYRRKH
jgi:hypothetical protein